MKEERNEGKTGRREAMGMYLYFKGLIYVTNVFILAEDNNAVAFVNDNVLT